MSQREVDFMLLGFRVKNFRSFADETYLDLRAKPIKEHADTLIEENGVGILPTIGIYGANGAGKSNLFAALWAFQRMLHHGIDREEKPLGIEPFKYSDLISAPVEMEMEFSIDDYEYKYGFETTKEKILSEWLFKRKITKNRVLKKCIFYYNENDVPVVEVKGVDKEEILYCLSMKSGKTLVIAELLKRGRLSNAHVLEQSLTSDRLVIDSLSGIMSKLFNNVLLKSIYESENLRQKIVRSMNKVDNAIKDILVVQNENPNEKETHKMYTIHDRINKDDTTSAIKVPLAMESAGTQKIIPFYAFIYGVVMESGCTLVVDELDTQLHPLLFRDLIKMFQDKTINLHGAQLVFSAHNLICLNSDDLRRDEVWFVEKVDQQSTLYSLADFRTSENAVRNDLDFGKHYLAGRFGAVPFAD